MAIKKTRAKAKKKHPLLSVFTTILLIVLVLGLMAAGAVLYVVKDIIDDAPRIDPTRFSELWTQNAELLDRNGNLIEKIQSGGYRTVIDYDDMSPVLVDAYTSVEDKTFWDHTGFNYVRLVGAVWDAVTGDGRIGGTSTITQQAARNLYLADSMTERTMDRKIKEAYYTILMEQRLSKEQIIEAYLNTIYLGSGANGVEAASEIYFSKSAKDLDFIESAILAGIPKSPSAYSPMKTLNKEDVREDHIIIDDSDPEYTIVFNESSQDRYLTVVRLMRDNGAITEEEYEEAKKAPLYEKIVPGKLKDINISSYFSDLVKEDVIEDLMAEYGYSKEEATQTLYNQGLKIYSTMDLEIQTKVEGIYNQKDFSDYFGDSTEAAVRNFQRRYAIAVDGIVGQGTWTKLLELGAVEEQEVPDYLLRTGMTDGAVVTLKESLNKMGFFNNHEYFPRVTVHMDDEKNIISENENILLYRYQNMVDADENLVIPASDYTVNDAGDFVLSRNRRLYFILRASPEGGDSRIDVYLKNTFTYDEEDPTITEISGRRDYLTPEQIEAGVRSISRLPSYNIPSFFTYTGRDLYIDDAYKSLDENNNLVLSGRIQDEPYFSRDSEGNILISKDHYAIDEKGTIQPQSAFVLTDYTTGELRALVGGRNVTGQKIYNRAVETRQPGSSIKPIAVYLPAIDSRRYTAATVVDDVPAYLGPNPDVRWPLNWYETGTLNESVPKYWGLMTVRKGIEQSLNVVTAKIADDLGPQISVDYLKQMGITSIVESGPVSDMNLSAMALGGMSNGISPIEMTEAYGTIANGGVHSETITYTRVEDLKGNVILEKTSEKNKVVDPQVAYIVQDMMKTGVTRGLSSSAQISPYNNGITVAGKTGTTTNKFDAWFVGYTPYYAAALWFGNDLNVPLDQGSKVSAVFWSKLMSAVHEDLEDADFEKPDGLVTVQVDTQSGKLPTELSYQDPRGSTVISEIFLPGTQPTTFDDVHVTATVDVSTNQLATPNCPEELVESRVFIQRQEPYDPEEHLNRNLEPIYPRDHEYVLPTEFCEIHRYSSENFLDRFDDEDKFTVFPGGTVYVIRPITITLTTGDRILLEFASRFNPNMSIRLPDGTVYEAEDYYLESIDNPQFVPPVVEELPEEDQEDENQ
ncbi:MAG: hypothetical protein AVO33_00630 [delta proteobacterium ML8_F1]|nr:MAG: hypothetical protein AVO33_00630 [delta proteobacterium ML8_F1]